MKKLIMLIVITVFAAELSIGMVWPQIETHIYDRNDSSQKWQYQDMLTYSMGNTVTLAGISAVDSSYYYQFFQTTAIAFVVTASDGNVQFKVFADVCRPVVGIPASYGYATADSLVVTSQGYKVFQVENAPYNEYVRFRFVAQSGNGSSTVLSRMRINRSWP